MKSKKKFVLAGLVLLATALLLPLTGCETEVNPSTPQQEQTDGNTGNSGGGNTQQPGGENAGNGGNTSSGGGNTGDGEDEVGGVKPVTYTVTFNANGGTETMASQIFTEGVAQKLTANGFTNGVKSFVGWAESADGAVKYADGEEVTITASITLYARWRVTAAEEYVAVVVEADGSLTSWTDLSDAVSFLNGTKGSTLYATKDITAASAFTLHGGDEFTIDLNGYATSFGGGTAITVVENSSLTITDGYGGGKLYNEGNYLISNYGDLTILGGTLEVKNLSFGYATISNNATMTISGGIVTNNNAHAISTNTPLRLSSNPVVTAGGGFASFGDLYEPINLVGALGTEPYTIEASMIQDNIIVKGVEYTITEEDVKKFSLIDGGELTLDAAANTIIKK